MNLIEEDEYGRCRVIQYICCICLKPIAAEHINALLITSGEDDEPVCGSDNWCDECDGKVVGPALKNSGLFGRGGQQ
jgi:hypothetical protein